MYGAVWYCSVCGFPFFPLSLSFLFETGSHSLALVVLELSVKIRDLLDSASRVRDRLSLTVHFCVSLAAQLTLVTPLDVAPAALSTNLFFPCVVMLRG